MHISSDADAAQFLHDTSYYRFSGYSHLYQIAPGAGGNDNFVSGVSFKDVQDVYHFDGRLRRVLREGLFDFEIRFRSRFAYLLATEIAPDAYLDPSIYTNKQFFTESRSQIDTELKRSKEKFALAYRRAHPTEEFPVWIAFEILSFGQISKLLSNLNAPRVMGGLAKQWEITPAKFPTVVYIMSLLRNIVSHHGRLWHRQMATRGVDIGYPIRLSRSLDGVDKRSVYWSIIMLDYLLKEHPGSGFRQDVLALLSEDSTWWAGLGIPNDRVIADLL